MLQPWDIKVRQHNTRMEAELINPRYRVLTHNWELNGPERKIYSPPLFVYKEFMREFYMKQGIIHAAWLFPLDIEFVITYPLRLRLFASEESF